MANYTAEVTWVRGEQPFLDNKYSRKHVLRFDGGIEVPGSSSPHVVALPYSEAAAIDPEEAFVSSLSSCHMLWFLSMAVKHKFIVDRYHDVATGVMAKNADARWWIATVTLHPQAHFSGARQPTREELDAMHHEAHELCFIASSVKTDVRCEPIYE